MHRRHNITDCPFCDDDGKRTHFPLPVDDVRGCEEDMAEVMPHVGVAAPEFLLCFRLWFVVEPSSEIVFAVNWK